VTELAQSSKSGRSPSRRKIRARSSSQLRATVATCPARCRLTARS